MEGESNKNGKLRDRAEAAFRKEEQARQGAQAWTEYEAQICATRQKTARLRAQRLEARAARIARGNS